MESSWTVEALGRASEAEILAAFPPDMPETDRDLLCKALMSTVYDPGLKAYDSVLGRSREMVVTDALLRALPGAREADRSRMIRAITRAVKGYWTGFEGFTVLFLRYAGTEGISALVLPLCEKLLFAEAMLMAMLDADKLVKEWVQAIYDLRRRRALKPAFDYEEPDYTRIDDLLARCGMPV